MTRLDSRYQYACPMPGHARLATPGSLTVG